MELPALLENTQNESSPPQKYRYLSPSVFWSIRQGFPTWLSMLLVALSLLIPLTAWTVISSLKIVPSLFLPTPLAVVQAGIQMFTENNLVGDVLASCSRVLAGFVLSALIGVPIGLAMGTFHSMDRIFSPLVGMVRYMPITGFVPLIIIWLGLDEVSKVAIVTLGVVLYNVIMVADAVKFIPNEMINVFWIPCALIFLGHGILWSLPNSLRLRAAWGSELFRHSAFCKLTKCYFALA
jgi:NitT/TauT family transport system permease protein